MSMWPETTVEQAIATSLAVFFLVLYFEFLSRWTWRRPRDHDRSFTIFSILSRTVALIRLRTLPRALVYGIFAGAMLLVISGLGSIYGKIPEADESLRRHREVLEALKRSPSPQAPQIPSSVSVPEIENILGARIPDQAIQEQRQREVIEKLNEINRNIGRPVAPPIVGPADPKTTSSIRWAWDGFLKSFWPYIAGFIVIFALGKRLGIDRVVDVIVDCVMRRLKNQTPSQENTGLVGAGKLPASKDSPSNEETTPSNGQDSSENKKLLWIGMMKFGTLSIFSGCSLFSINALVGEMNVESMFNIRYYTSPEVKIEYTHNGRSIECGIGNEFYDIYPFRSGISELHPDADSVAFGKYEKLKEDLLKKSGLVQNVIVIGYVDKREFRDSPRNSLGANAVLAGQRANTVSKRLIDDLKLPETSAVLLQNAPRLINQGSDPNDLEADRAVRVCVLWG